MKQLATSVVICGAGPVGLTLAHLLALEGIATIVLDKLDSTVAEPRAIALDGESLRTLQKLGLVDGFTGELLSGLIADYVNGKGEHLFKIGRPGFRPFGYETINSFDQPKLDRYLAEQLAHRPGVELRFRHLLTGVEQDAAGVRVYATSADDGELEIRADFLIGCDGGRSTVRSLLNIGMTGASNPQPWLVIDTKDAYLDGQMDCRFFCDPSRPGMTIRKRHGERRWEWMLMPGEDRAYLLDDETIRALIAPYTDVEQVTVYRKQVYDFHAIIAERWRDGRVFLAGDAAHMTPPFAGQGLNSGIRDVTNLSWKLALVLRGQADIALLESYEQDRRDHAWELIETALALGNQIQPIDAAQAAERDAFFAELQKDPAALQAIEDDIARSTLDRRVHASLVIDGEQSAVAGKLLLQPALASGRTRDLLDHHLGDGFAILGFNCDPRAVLREETSRQWDGWGASIVRVHSSTDDLRGGDLRGGDLLDDKNELGDWLGGAEPAVLLIRPDRFCMVHAHPREADDRLRRAHALLAGGV
ncbi:MAG: bifunctional 3-(3-hydroxy-phenyl)propionate/3-hydroxycinnamic acid hydroxylase [Haliea sp.]|nr:bifunctional 3-(3-hydroxy-phenyl)propionate/3-hydroxycinnamic acid hydroxylase [Haliea sp.]